MSRPTALADIQVGHEVLVFTAGYRPHWTVREVTSKTPQFIRTGQFTFYRANGAGRGEWAKGMSIVPWTPGNTAKYEEYIAAKAKRAAEETATRAAFAEQERLRQEQRQAGQTQRVNAVLDWLYGQSREELLATLGLDTASKVFYLLHEELLDREVLTDPANPEPEPTEGERS